jgi:hypothetical protein
MLLAAGVAGCSGDAALTGRLAAVSAATVSGATVAFESIDGPPSAVFQKLVRTLTEEADARQVAVVSRAGPASYRVRGYVSAMVERRKVSFAWVWDVYDADKRRVLRLSGEEPASSGHRDAWLTADDAVVRRIARAGMTGIAEFIHAPGPAPRPVPMPEPGPRPASGPTVALVSDR